MVVTKAESDHFSCALKWLRRHFNAPTKSWYLLHGVLVPGCGLQSIIKCFNQMRHSHSWHRSAFPSICWSKPFFSSSNILWMNQIIFNFKCCCLPISSLIESTLKRRCYLSLSSVGFFDQFENSSPEVKVYIGYRLVVCEAEYNVVKTHVQF